ncbi:MAG: DUF4383 domain-containing protein [Candidatus Peregrinibacteria bacterium]|nr:DUF4383 domain-containing protein [Candidatus Peregrinibacteria bacterium]
MSSTYLNSARRSAALLLGLVLFGAGYLGFFSEGVLLHLQVDSLQNFFHVGTGAVALIAAFEEDRFTHWALLLLGVTLGLLSVDGFVWNGTLFDLFPLTSADNYAYMVLSSVALVVSVWEVEKMFERPARRRLLRVRR